MDLDVEETPVAGPSRLPGGSREHTPPPPTAEAPYYPIPTSTSFYAIEYPGPVSSIPRALDTMGGLDRVTAVFASSAGPSRLANSTPQPAVGSNEQNNNDDAGDASAPTGNGDGKRKLLELNLNPSNPHFHPVQAQMMDVGSVVLKLTKRRRKRPRLGSNGEVVEAGVFSVEPVGIVDTTARFRAMADFQYLPNLEDPAVQMAQAMRNLDVDAIQSYSFPIPDEDYSGNILLPPPVFSRQTLPLFYEYKPAPGAIPTTSTRASGEEVHRLVSHVRFKTSSQRAIPFSATEVPTGPDPELVKGRTSTWKPVEAAINKVLERRPVWLRSGLINQLDSEDARMVNNHKAIISLNSYTFSDGPFRELVIRFGYDPRKHPEARFYQRVAFRNPGNVRSKMEVGTSRVKEKEKEVDSHLSHIFDGVTTHRLIGNFQLCDITDELCKSLIESPDGVQPKCSSEPEGWYDPDYYEQIRQVVRRKWTGVHNGLVVTKEDCEDLLVDPKLAAEAAGGAREGKKTGGSSRGRRGSSAGGGGRRGRRRSGSESSRADEEDDNEREDEEEARSGGSDQESGSEGSEATRKARKKSFVRKRAPWEKVTRKKVGPKQPAEARSGAKKGLQSVIGVKQSGEPEEDDVRGGHDEEDDFAGEVEKREQEEEEDDDDSSGTGDDD